MSSYSVKRNLGIEANVVVSECTSYIYLGSQQYAKKKIKKEKIVLKPITYTWNASAD